MTKVKINTQRIYKPHSVIVSKAEIFDGTISAQSMRLHCLMRSMPDSWNPTIGGYATLMRRKGMRASRESVKDWVGQLKRQGYIDITKLHDSGSGKWIGYVWAIYPERKAQWLQNEIEYQKGLEK